MNDNKHTKHRPTTDDSALSDVEAHGFRGNAVPEDETAEGHGMRGSALPEDEGTEGHIAKSGRALPDDEGDDTEGHGVRPRI
jgi:hypothetical protein